MSKTELVNQGIAHGLEQKDLEAKYDEYFTFGKSLGQLPEEQEQYADRMLKRFIKKELMTPREMLSFVVLGDRLTDWGELNRRMLKAEVFPADHKRAGQKIPEHDYVRTVMVYSHMNHDIVQIVIRDTQAYSLQTGFEYQGKFKKGMKPNVFLWENDKTVVTTNGQVDLRKLVVTMNNLIVKRLALLETTEAKLVLINAQTIVEIRDLWGDFVVTIDDDSMGIDAKKINVKFDEAKVNFADTAQGVIMLAEVIKKTDTSIELQGFGAYPKAEDVLVKPQPIESGGFA